MTRGGYVRTNYRRLTGMPKMDAIGGSYPKSSQATLGKTAGAGTTDPYGGFMWLSYTGTLVNASDNASVAGISGQWVESTYGLMASYFGAGAFTSGYVFQPVFAHVISISDRIMSAGEFADAVDASLGFIFPVGSFGTSGSIARIGIYRLMMAAGAPSVCSMSLFSEAAITLQIGGFIVSGP